MDILTQHIGYVQIRTGHARGFKSLMSRSRLGPFPLALHDDHSFFQEPHVFDFRSMSLRSEEGMNRVDFYYEGTGTVAHQSS